MSDKNDMDHHCGALLEDVNHKFDAICEGLTPLASLSGKVDDMNDRLERVESDITVIKLAVKDQTAEYDSLVKQVTKRWNKR